MLNEVNPNTDNCLQLCSIANIEYADFVNNPPLNELLLIDWRVNNMPLDKFTFTDECMNHLEVVLFKANYEKSSDYFYELMETNEKNNSTERVNVCLATLPEENIFHHFILAVSPKDTSVINLDLIQDALLDEAYHSFYIDSPDVFIDAALLSVPNFSVYVGENGAVVFDKINTAQKIKGQFIIYAKPNEDVIKEFKKPWVKINVDRVL